MNNRLLPSIRAADFAALKPLLSILLLLGLATASSGQSVLLGGFDNNEGIVAQHPSALGKLSVSMTGGNAGRDYAGDASGHWGTASLSPAASTTNFAINQAFGDLPDFVLTVTNVSATEAATLERLRWVSKREHLKSETTYSISATGDIAATGSITGSLGAGDDAWLAFDINIASLLSSNQLAPGQSVSFTLAWTGQTGTRSFMVDNLALSGTINAAPASSGLQSFDTGHTVIKVSSGIRAGQSVIVGASYEGTVLAMDYQGNLLWTNPLSGYMVRDLWCGDLDGDGSDEVLAAVSDGSVHCLKISDGSAHWAQPFHPNEAPMNAVCMIQGASAKYVACGGFDRKFYWLNADGTLHSAIDSAAYSTERPWGTGRYYLGRDIGYADTPNFMRPIPQPDGTDRLMIHAYKHMQFGGPFYEFEPLAPIPTKLPLSPNIGDSIGALEIADPDGDGSYSIYIGGNSFDFKVESLNLASATSDYHSEPFTVPFKTYRFAALTDFPSAGGYKHLAMCGNKILVLSPGLAAVEDSLLLPDAFHHLWNDRDKKRILLSSSQSGGSAIHVIDTSHPDWKQELLNLQLPGKMASMKTNYDAIRGQVASFVRPAWERQPDQVVEASSDSGHPVAVALRAKYGVANPLFTDFAHTTNVQTQDWKATAPQSNVLPLIAPSDEPYLHEFDNGITYGRTPQQLYDQHFQPHIDGGDYGLSFRAGHGNDPYYYQPQTLFEAIDRNFARGPERVTVVSWAEVQTTSDDVRYPLGRLFAPVADHLKTRNGIMSFNNKHMFWSSTIHKEAWSDFVAGRLKEVFRPCMEESTTKTPELSLSGRIGLWASGSFDNWGMRTTRDNTSFDRSREIAAQIVPNHFLRQMVYRLAYGARFSHSSYTDVDYQSLVWELVASGALYIPRREEIVSFSPVHVSIADPDERYIAGNEIPKWTTYYDAAEQAANPMVFGRLEGCWLGGKNTDWDFSRYAAGVKDRRLNFLPPFPHGLVLNTPVENGPDAAPADYRNRLVDNLHPLYRTILKEHVTDGRDYIEADGVTRHAANSSYFHNTVKADIENGAAQLPVSVSGGAAWVCVQTHPSHLRLTLVDSGYLNPSATVATVVFNTVTPVALTDLLTGESIPVSGSAAQITVPLGMFRFVDIEIEDPNLPPAFTVDPISKPNATEGVAYNASIAGNASDPESDPLTFSKVSGPAWLNVGSNGSLSGAPGSGDLGNNSFTVQVSATGGSGTATLNIPVVAGSAQTPYGGSVRNLPGIVQAEDFDEGGEGIAYHDTTNGNAGNSYRTSENIDLQSSADTGGGINVGWTADGEWIEYAVNLPSSNYDISARFASPNAGGQLRIILGNTTLATLNVPQTGAWQTWQTATAGNIPVAGGNGKTLRLEIVGGGFNLNWIQFASAGGGNQPPTFGHDPIAKPNAVENTPYSGSLAGDASDPEGNTMSFSKASGPAWLTIASSGAFGGAPSQSDIGPNVFTIQVSATGGSDTASLIIDVDPGPFGWTELKADDFENGWGNWTDGGDDAYLTSLFAIGAQCFGLQDDTESSVVTLTDPLDLTGLSELRIEFSYVVQSFEGSEDFWVQYSDDGGANWTTVKAYVKNVDFIDDGTRYDASLILDSVSYTFSNNVKIRFRCDATGDGDDVYIDDVAISVQ